MTAPGAPGGRRLRILVVNWLDRENPRSGGAETHLHEVFGRLASEGHEVTALVSGWRGCRRLTTLDGIEVRRSGGRHTFSITAPLHYLRHLRGRGYDVVVEDLNKVPLFSPVWTRSKVVLLAHHLFGTTAFQAGPLPVALGTVILERLIPLVFRRTPTIAVSESTKADLVRRGLREDRVEVIPNGVDLEFFTPGAGEASDRPTLAFLGRLAPYKRVDLIIDAVALLAKEGLTVRLLVAGEGDQSAALIERARQAGVESQVSFLGYVDEATKAEVLRTSWAHVLTSPKEGWGISIMEAAACGTPSVASDSPGLRESVVDGRTGLLVPHGDVAALALALRRILGDSELRATLGGGALDFARSFSWDATAGAVAAFLLRVVGEPGRE